MTFTSFRVGRKGQGRDGIAKAALILRCHFYFHTQFKQEVAHCFCKWISLNFPTLGHNWYEIRQLHLLVTCRWPQKCQQHLPHTEPQPYPPQTFSKAGAAGRGSLAQETVPSFSPSTRITSQTCTRTHPKLVTYSILCRSTWTQTLQTDGRLKDSTSLEESLVCRHRDTGTPLCPCCWMYYPTIATVTSLDGSCAQKLAISTVQLLA